MSVGWRRLLSLPIILAFTFLAAADEIRLKDGTTAQGTIVGASADFVILKGTDGKLKTYRKADIRETAKSESAPANISEATIQVPVGMAAGDTAQIDPAKIPLLEEYHQRKKAINLGEFDKNLELAEWCLQKGLTDEAKAEVNYVLKTDDLAQFKKTFVFCARNKAESILAEAPSAWMIAAFASMKEKHDPLLAVCKDLLLSAKEVRGAESRVRECDAAIASAKQQSEMLENQDKAISEWHPSGAAGAFDSTCPQCQGKGTIPKFQRTEPGKVMYEVPLSEAWRYRLDSSSLKYSGYPHKWVPAHPVYFDEPCPTCRGGQTDTTVLQGQLESREKIEHEMSRRIAELARYSSKLVDDRGAALDSVRSAKEHLEKKRAQLLLVVDGMTTVPEKARPPRPLP